MLLLMTMMMMMMAVLHLLSTTVARTTLQGFPVKLEVPFYRVVTAIITFQT